MISPSEKLQQFVKLYENRAVLCERVGIDEAMLSKLMKRERGASAKTIEKVCRFTGWAMQDAWELIDGESNE